VKIKGFLEGYRSLCESAQTRPLSDAMREEWRQHAEMAELALCELARREQDATAGEIVVDSSFLDGGLGNIPPCPCGECIRRRAAEKGDG